MARKQSDFATGVAIALLVILAAAVFAFSALASTGCGPIFPKCDDPKRPCPPVEPSYPFEKKLDAGLDGS